MSNTAPGRLLADKYALDEQDLARLQRDDKAYLSDKGAAVIMGASRTSHLILATTCIFLIAAIAWASLATLDEVTRGEGKVIPSGKVQVIQNLEGGILTELMVAEGDIVDREQPLLAVSGHIHEATGTDQIDNCTLVNPGPFKLGDYACAEIVDSRVTVQCRQVSV